MALRVNDVEHEVDAPDDEVLADSLRNRLGLTGVKQACGMGNCGSCTVRLDGDTVYSCLVLTAECHGRTVVTVEGLACGDELDPVQRAFVDADALQCGFCTPGQIMSARAVLDANPCPTAEDVVHGLTGNLCRCGAYAHIIEATKRDGTVVAAPRRVDGAPKVTGRARYSSDVQLPGQLEARILRSPIAHATVQSVDAQTARTLPGVHAVLTHDDVTAIKWYEEQTPLLTDVARFVGDELAVVAADTAAAAERAIASIDVSLDPRAHATDHRDAVASDAPIVNDATDDNVIGEVKRYERGDVDAAFARASHVVEGTYGTPAQVHHALEAHGAVASWDGETLTAYVSTQSVHDVRDGLAEALGLSIAQVRVVCDYMGGGFGAKQVVWKPTVLCALLSMRTGRPVRLVLDRRAEALSVGHRNRTQQRVRIAADEEGRLLAVDADLLVANGAYAVGGESSSVDGPYQYLYRCPNVRTSKTTVRTNHGPSVAFRAPGYVEAAFALESAMDELAGVIGIDPVELRRRNLPDDDQVDDKPLSSPRALETCIDRATETFGWAPPRTRVNDGRRRRGFGFACHDWLGGKPHPPAYAHVNFDTDGSVTVVAGTQDIGTGTRTVLAQVAAGELCCDPHQIRVTIGDTGHGLYAPVSSGSATVPTMVPAVREAARAARRSLLDAAAERCGRDAADLTLHDGHIVLPDGERIDITEVLESTGRRISGRGAIEGSDRAVSIRTFGAVCAEVEVDMLTGAIDILRIVSAPDCGTIINPLLAESQVIGGVTQGIGFALTEREVIDDRLGAVLNANLEDYLVPTIADRCEITHAPVDLPDPHVEMGAKGLGEVPMIAVAPAIANAIHDATGVRFRELPITRRRLLDQLAERRTS